MGVYRVIERRAEEVDEGGIGDRREPGEEGLRQSVSVFRLLP